MGNWRNQPRFYRQKTPRSPPRSSYYDRNSPPYGFSDNGVPAWEKKFCSLVGSVPWRKVVEARSFMSCHGNVISWDDSAGAEAFDKAKKRFWSEWNGLPCDISLPDPDMYIDEVNWNTVIDPELIRDLEQGYFAPPDEGRIDFKLGHKNKKTRNSKTLPVDECNRKEEIINNPCECYNYVQSSDLLWNGNTSQGWNLWDSSINNSVKDPTIGENPWEPKATQGNEKANTNTWGDFYVKGWEDKGRESSGCEDKDWDSTGWDNCGDTSWGSKWHDTNKPNNDKNNPWRRSSVRDNGASRDNGRGDNGVNTRGWKRPSTDNVEQKRWEFKRSSDGWEDSNGVSLKREGNHGCESGYRNSRFKRNANRTGNDWRNEKANKRVTFAAK